VSELRFDGRAVLVTGAGRGIGREHALLLAARGGRARPFRPTPSAGHAPYADGVRERACGGIDRVQRGRAHQ
jgi:NAD(P)-dependent dehydrogenase (short-subunit alcohol dehydrogenase family)